MGNSMESAFTSDLGPGRREFDAVIVGAGPNGLAAAVALAREGFRVCVIEAADEPGGGTRSVADTTIDGLIHDHCAAVHPMGAASPFFRSLPLDDYGLRWRHPEIAVAHPLEGGSAAVAYRDLAQTVDGLGEDGEVWQRIFGPVVADFDAAAEHFLGPVARLPHHGAAAARVARHALLPATVVANKFSTGAARALFGGIAAHLMAPLDRPMSSGVGIMLGAAGHAYGWPVAEGGSASIWKALVAYLESLGGEVRTGMRVRSMNDIPRARVALFDVVPAEFLAIVGHRLPARHERRMAAWQHGVAAFKVDYVIDGEVPWRAEAARRAGTVHVGGSFAAITAAESATAAGEHTDRPFVLVTQPAVADPSRRVDGFVPVWAYAHVPHDSVVDVAHLIDRQIERFAPGFGQQVRARRITTPQAFAADNPNFVGGDIAGGSSAGVQLLARPRRIFDPYATGIPGAFLCSAATPPGAGVHGMCGYYAAQSALRVLTA